MAAVGIVNTFTVMNQNILLATACLSGGPIAHKLVIN